MEFIGVSRHHRRRSDEEIEGDVLWYHGLQLTLMQLNEERQEIDDNIRMVRSELSALAMVLRDNGVSPDRLVPPCAPHQRPLDHRRVKSSDDAL